MLCPRFRVMVVAPACKQERAGWRAFMGALGASPRVCGVRFLPLDEVGTRGPAVAAELAGAGEAGEAEGPGEPCAPGAREGASPPPGARTLVVHKPQNVFLPGHPVGPGAYRDFLASLPGRPIVVDPLDAIAQTLSRGRVVSLLQEAGIPVPRTVELRGHRVGCADSPGASTSPLPAPQEPRRPFPPPFFVKPDNSAVHMLRYCASWEAAGDPAPPRPGEPPSALLAQEFLPHARLYKVYTFEGRVNRLAVRGSLDLAGEAGAPPGPAPGAAGAAAGAFRDFNSQTCPSVKRNLDEEVPEGTRRHLEDLARRVHAVLGLSYVGLDVLHTLDDRLVVCDVNYMSGPKEPEAGAVAEQLLARALRLSVGGPGGE